MYSNYLPSCICLMKTHPIPLSQSKSVSAIFKILTLSQMTNFLLFQTESLHKTISNLMEVLQKGINYCRKKKIKVLKVLTD